MTANSLTGLVSVVIPTWNRSSTIISAVESVLNQTYSKVEVLVCDDFSNDNTSELIHELIKVEKRVKWVPGCADHRGRPAIPRNRGLKIASGEWIAFLDSDDVWEKNKLQLQLEAAKKTSVHFLSTNAARMVNNKNVGPIIGQGSGVLNFKEIWKENYIICSSVLIHKSLRQKIGYMPEGKECLALEDYAYWLRALLFSDVFFLKDQLVRYTDDPSVSVRAQGEQEHSLQIRNVRQNLRGWAMKDGSLNAKWLYLKKILSVR